MTKKVLLYIGVSYLFIIGWLSSGIINYRLKIKLQKNGNVDYILCSLFLTNKEKSVLFMSEGGGAKLY